MFYEKIENLINDFSNNTSKLGEEILAKPNFLKIISDSSSIFKGFEENLANI